MDIRDKSIIRDGQIRGTIAARLGTVGVLIASRVFVDPTAYHGPYDPIRRTSRQYEMEHKIENKGVER